MTTNVVDTAACILASDSRWSFPVLSMTGNTHAWIYVDDADFDKIEVGKDYSFIFAGSSTLMEEWKTWHRQPLMSRPRVEDGFSLCFVNMATRNVEFEHGQRIVGSDHRFAGTGAYYAYQCWIINKSAKKAVESAYRDDILSGGTVKYLDLNTKNNNINAANVSKSINQKAAEKGLVMYMNQSAPKGIPLAAAAAGDPLVKEALKKVASGSVAAQAPAGQDKIVWTDLDIQKLDAALARCFGGKKQ